MTSNPPIKNNSVTIIIKTAYTLYLINYTASIPKLSQNISCALKPPYVRT